MPDEKHVLSAIRFFNYVSMANEKELAQDMDLASYRNKYLVMKRPSQIKCTVAKHVQKLRYGIFLKEITNTEKISL